MNDMPKLAEIGSGALQHLANLKELSITHSPQLTSIAEDAFSGETKELSWPPLSKVRELHFVSCCLDKHPHYAHLF